MATIASYLAFQTANAGTGPQGPPLRATFENPTHLQSTLHEIHNIANDVEMLPPPSEWGRYVIVDTNVLLSHYEALKTFVEDVEKTKAPVILVFPGIVVQELDRQKNRERLAWPARRASGWLLEQVRARKGVMVQATEQTCKPSGNWRTRMSDEIGVPEDMMNDHLIIDCAQYFQFTFRSTSETFLCSADNNLCIVAVSQNLQTITPPSRGLWTSRDIACSLYGLEFPGQTEFSSSTAAYRVVRKPGKGNSGSSQSTAGSGSAAHPASSAAIQDPDSMMIDDDDSDTLSTEETPLNVLHDDVREYFTRLLLQLVSRLGAGGLQAAGTLSRHAPEYLKKDFRLWNASECLEYLYDQSQGLKQRMKSPRPDVFLSKRYTARGARTGQEWSTADWGVGLSNMGGWDLAKVSSGSAMNKRRAFYVCLSVLAVFLLGTVVVLSSVTYFLAIDPAAYLSELEVPFVDNTTRTPPSSEDRIPRIIHQTWKTDELPDRWKPVSKGCRDMMPDYEYMLWSDESSRDFIKEHYSWFLDTFDGYTYPIQRADVIRYFVLHHYGGIYVDLDIGCLRPMDPLLKYPVILPKTIPVGVSNDLMFGEKGHPFFQQTINSLVTFDHSWILNYPTVMFSTGPMFLSAQYGIYVSSHPKSALSDIRILPKSLYGKNAKPEEAPHTFFSHFYGSSWHADDAAFIGFLGHWGKVLLWIGLVILIVGVVRLPKGQRRSLRRMGGYDVLMPRASRSGRWYLPLPASFLSGSSTPTPTQPRSPVSSEDSTSSAEAEVPFLRLHVNPPSPSLDVDEQFALAGRNESPIANAFRRVRNRVSNIGSPREPVPMTPVRPRRTNRGVLFFLPAIFTTVNHDDIEMDPASPTSPQPPPSYTPSNWSRSGSRPSSIYGADEKARPVDLEAGQSESNNSGSSSNGSSSRHDQTLINLSSEPPAFSSSAPSSRRST